MGNLAVLGIALALAMDAFSVSLVVGSTVSPLTRRHFFRLAWHFGLFQFLMPLIGWLAGISAERYIAGYDHWVAASLLLIVGGRMIWSVLRPEEENLKGDPTRGMTLVMLSVATSIDALAVGVSLAALRVSIWQPAVIIGIVCGVLTLIGMKIGARLGRMFGGIIPLIGGLILCGIAVKIVVEHTR